MRRFWEWQKLGEFSKTDYDSDFIEDRVERLARDEIQPPLGTGVYTIIRVNRHKDLGVWKLKHRRTLKYNNGVFISLSSLSMLMNPLKAVNSGWQVQIQADVTFRVCMEDVALLGFGVNSLGAQFNLCVLSIIPNSIENERVYSETWESVNRALNLLLRNYKRCPLKDCVACDILTGVRDMGNVQELLSARGEFYIPVALAGSDNHPGFANFVHNNLPHATLLQCFSHLTGNV